MLPPPELEAAETFASINFQFLSSIALTNDDSLVMDNEDGTIRFKFSRVGNAVHQFNGVDAAEDTIDFDNLEGKYRVERMESPEQTLVPPTGFDFPFEMHDKRTNFDQTFYRFSLEITNHFGGDLAIKADGSLEVGSVWSTVSCLLIARFYRHDVLSKRPTCTFLLLLVYAPST